MQATTTTPLFSAELTPNRALSPKGITTVTSLCLLFGAWPGLAMLSIGVVPIAVLMAATALAIAGSLHVFLRQGHRREQMTVWADQLEWASIDAHGTRSLKRFNPKSVKLIIHRDADEKTTTLCLRDGKDTLEIGAFLRSEDKSSFAKALGTALRKARAA